MSEQNIIGDSRRASILDTKRVEPPLNGKIAIDLPKRSRTRNNGQIGAGQITFLTEQDRSGDGARRPRERRWHWKLRLALPEEQPRDRRCTQQSEAKRQ